MDKDVYIQELLYSSIKKEWSNAIYSNMDGPVIVQSHSQVLLFVALWTTVHQASLSFTISWSLLKFLESMMQSNHLILCRPLLLLPSIFPSIRVFSNESALHIRWPKDWTFSFSISPSNEYSGLISFRIDWLHLLAVQGTLKSLLQHHSSKSWILQCSAFFMVQLSHPYMTTGRNIKRSLAQKRVQMVSGLYHLLYDFRQITLIPQFLHLYQKCYSRICETNVWKALSSAHGMQSVLITFHHHHWWN